jgi:hypothetical protein
MSCFEDIWFFDNMVDNYISKSNKLVGYANYNVSKIRLMQALKKERIWHTCELGTNLVMTTDTTENSNVTRGEANAKGKKKATTMTPCDTST